MGADHSINHHNKEGKDIIFFDGVCNLCDGTVNFIFKRDDRKRFLYASLQSGFARRALSGYQFNPDNLESIALLTKEKQLFIKSDAVLKIAGQLGHAWPLLKIFKIIPRPVRDGLYSFIARNRYKIFGKNDHCIVPTVELQQRFLDAY